MDTRIPARDLYERGRMLRLAKMYDRALADFTGALQDPYYVGKAHTQIALCFRALGRHGEAAAALRRALDSSMLSENEQLHVLYHLAAPCAQRRSQAAVCGGHRDIRQPVDP